MLRIIHISDFHLENENISHQKENIIKALFTDLERYIDENTIIAFTGDLIDKGGKGFLNIENSFNTFQNLFIDKVLKKFSLPRNRFFMIPGNHDIVRPKNNIEEEGLRSILKYREAINKFIDDSKVQKTHLERVNSYKTFEERFYSSIENCSISIFDSNFIVELNGTKLGVACLNSSWRCYDESDKGRLIIGENQVLNSVKFLSACDIKIALAHHPLDWLFEEDKKIVKPIIDREFDILLCGHVHNMDGNFNQSIYGRIFQSVSASTIADRPNDRQYVNGYCIIDFYKGQSIEVTYRKYIEDHNSFLPFVEVGSENGTKIFKIPTEVEIEKQNIVRNVIEHIKSIHFSNFNEQLIIHNTDTKTICDINTIFVEPRISNLPNNNLDDENIKNYSIDDILKFSHNFLIYGNKEIGKTTLINKILIDTTEKYNILNQIPVLINFNDLSNKEIKSLIRNFWSLNIDHVDDLLKNEKIILLVDNLNFDEKNIHKINKLIRFKNENPNVKIIATSEQTVEISLPIDYLTYNHEFRFDLGFIQQLNTKEIKVLIRNWFTGIADYRENIEKVVKNFLALSLPRTSLSVTLFLWIIERQEQKPINNSTLIELFVENLLEKANFDNIYSDNFDFKNKQRLLAFLSKYMLEEGEKEENYRITEEKIRIFLKEYLENKFDIDPELVLKDFWTRGILIKDGKYIRFKAAFYFHFFLAKLMEYSKDFKDFVISDENFQEFIEEIDLYTGLKRDDLDVFKFTQDKLDVAFSELEEVLNGIDIDRMFETKDMLAHNLDFDKVKNKPTEEEIDKVYDEQLSSIPSESKIPSKTLTAKVKKNKQISLDKILKLSASVLRNSEEIDDFNFRGKAYQNVLNKSILFLIMYRYATVKLYFEQELPQGFPSNIDFKIFIRFLPLIHQALLQNWLGSWKLRPVVRNKIEEDKNSDVSELEKFLSVFIYSDIKGSDHNVFVDKFVQNIKYKYVKDSSFFKLMNYYHLRSKTAESDRQYLKLLSDLISNNNAQKNKLIDKWKRDKQLKLFPENEDE